MVYTFRLICLSIVRAIKLSGYYSFNDNDAVMLGSISIIILIVIFGGGIIGWLIFLDLPGIVLRLRLKILTLGVCIVGALLGCLIGLASSINIQRGGKWAVFTKNLLGEIWFLPYLSTYRINHIGLKCGYLYYKIIDSGWGELLGGQGIYHSLIITNKRIRYIQPKNLFFIIFTYGLLVSGLLLLYLDSLYRA